MDFEYTELKTRRLELEMTQLEVAKKCGVSLMGYQNWERGANKPSEEHERILYEVLGL